MLTKPPALADYLGKKIEQLCPFSLGKDNTKNHCAHFVSHVMEYDAFATTCKNRTSADKLLPGQGAAIRVNDLFNAAETGPWSARPLGLASCLIFVTNSGNIRHGEMLDGESKHVGIYIDGVVWHYSSARKGVEKVSERLFIVAFSHSGAYIRAKQTVDFFYGRLLK